MGRKYKELSLYWKKYKRSLKNFVRSKNSIESKVTGLNLNQSSAIQVPIFSNIIETNTTKYSINENDDELTILETGLYILFYSVNVRHSSGSARMNLDTWLEIVKSQESIQAGHAQSYYIRNASSHKTSSGCGFVVMDLEPDDIVCVCSKRASSSGSLVFDSEKSEFCIARIK